MMVTLPKEIIINYDTFSVNKLNRVVSRFLSKDHEVISNMYNRDIDRILDRIDIEDEDIFKKIYLKILSKYVNYTIVGIPDILEPTCVCGIKLEEFIEINNDYKECPTCFSVVEKQVGFQEYEKDMRDSKPKLKDVRMKMEEDFRIYEGSASTTFSMSDMINRLDSYMKDRDLLTHEEAIYIPCLSNGKKPGTSLKLMRDALKYLKLSYSKFAILISYNYWGWECPNISHIKDMFLDMYEEIYIVYQTLTIEERLGRKPNLPKEYLKYKLLQLCGVTCDVNDFKLPMCEDTLKKNDKIFELVCNKCSDRIRFYPTL